MKKKKYTKVYKCMVISWKWDFACTGAKHNADH